MKKTVFASNALQDVPCAQMPQLARHVPLLPINKATEFASAQNTTSSLFTQLESVRNARNFV